MNLFSKIKKGTSSLWERLYSSKRNIIIASLLLIVTAFGLYTFSYMLFTAKEYAQAQQIKQDAKALRTHLQTASSKLQKLSELRKISPFKTKIQSNGNMDNENTLVIVSIVHAQSSYDTSKLESFIRHAQQTIDLSNELLSEIQAIKATTIVLQQRIGNANRYVDENLYAEVIAQINETENTINATYEMAEFYAEYGKASALFATGIAKVEIQLQQKQDVQNTIVVAQRQLEDADKILTSINKNDAFSEELKSVSQQTQRTYIDLSKSLSQLTVLSNKNPDTQVLYIQEEIVGQLAIDYEKWREIEHQVLDQEVINRFNTKAQELSQKVDQANQNQPSNFQVAIKVFTKEENVKLSLSSGFQTFRGMHIDSANNPIVLPGQKITVTNTKTGDEAVTTDAPTFSFWNLTPNVQMYRVVANPIPGYKISNMTCHNCTSPTAYTYSNGNVFDILIPENVYYGVYFKYTKDDGDTSPTTSPTVPPIPVDDLGITISNIKTGFTIKAGESQSAFTITSTGSSGISMYGYPTSYGSGINWNISSAGLTTGRSVDIKIQVNKDIPAGVYKGSATIISYPSQKRYSIPDIEVVIQKETNANLTPTSSVTSPIATTAPTQVSVGLQLSVSSVDLTIEDGKSAKAFDITSTGATGFLLYGYPTSYGPGINWSVSSGGISSGNSTPVSIQINNGINPGTYSGTAIVKNQNGAQISIPVRVTIPVKATAMPAQGSRYVKVTSPNGGETLRVGDKINIQWEGKDIDKCSIGYSFGAGSFNNIVSLQPTTGNGSYEWTVNIGNTANTQVKIDLLCYKTGVGQASDQSDSFFTVNP